MKILVSGSSGLIGSALVDFLTARGHTVIRLIRSSSSSPSNTIVWNPESRELDTRQLEGLDAVVHLAGENLSTGRWTPEKKIRIAHSRVDYTRFLGEFLARLQSPPTAWLCASAIGYYGNRGDEVLREESAPGVGFLADLCRQWEAATEPAQGAGIRVALLRFGVVLSPAGGALAKMLPPFRWGLGGRLGDGKQYMSWITLADAVGAIHHVLTQPELQGAVNVTAPHPVTNLEFTKTIGKILSRPTLFSVPAFVLRCVMGEMANELLLAGACVAPTRLIETGYVFQYPELEAALRGLLGKP